MWVGEERGTQDRVAHINWETKNSPTFKMKEMPFAQLMGRQIKRLKVMKVLLLHSLMNPI
jgi:hypothetical protein